MTQPTPTATEKQIQKDGRLLLRMIKLVAKIELPADLHFDATRPTIAAGNHQSLLDVFLSAAFCANADVSCRFLVQARYFESKVAGRWLRRIGCIPINAETKDVAFAEAIASLDRRELIGIMPEGRLTKPEDRNPQLGECRPGVAELARLSNAVVRPIAFHRTGEAWPRGKWPKLQLRRPTVSMTLGEPIDLLGTNDEEDARRVGAALTALLNDIDANGPR